MHLSNCDVETTHFSCLKLRLVLQCVSDLMLYFDAQVVSENALSFSDSFICSKWSLICLMLKSYCTCTELVKVVESYHEEKAKSDDNFHI